MVLNAINAAINDPIHNLNVRRKVTLGNQIKTLALDIKNIFDDHPELLSSQSALISRSYYSYNSQEAYRLDSPKQGFFLLVLPQYRGQICLYFNVYYINRIYDIYCTFLSVVNTLLLVLSS